MEDLRTLIAGLRHWTDRLVPDLDRAEQLGHDLGAMVRVHDLDGGMPLSGQLVTLVEETCHRTARHLTLELHDCPTTPDEDPPGWPPVPRDVVALRAGYVRSVMRNGAIGELRIDGFDEVEHASSYLRGAFALLQGCDGVVLDLRFNGGGAMSSLALLAEFVLGPEPEHLATVHQRVQPAREWWTTGSLRGATLTPGVRVAILTGPGTYSSGEALAYHLQHRGRVRTFGARTPGAADHVTPVRVTPSVTALIPEGTPIDPRTGENWERRGVQPEVECDAAAAAALARDWLTS